MAKPFMLAIILLTVNLCAVMSLPDAGNIAGAAETIDVPPEHREKPPAPPAAAGQQPGMPPHPFAFHPAYLPFGTFRRYSASENVGVVNDAFTVAEYRVNTIPINPSIIVTPIYAK